MLSLVAGCAAAVAPEQLHIMYAAPNAVVAIWVADLPISQAPTRGLCVWGTTAANMTTVATADAPYTYSNEGGYNSTLYSANITGLPAPGTLVYYSCGFPDSFTPTTTFAVPPAPGSSSLRFVAFGDMGMGSYPGDVGHDSHFVQAALTAEFQDGGFAPQIVLSVGDMSYANIRALPNAWVTKVFWNEVVPFCSRAPMLICPGNHEDQFDFASHLAYTRMPAPSTGGGALGRFYSSMEVGPVHFLTYSTEHDVSTGSEQWNFIKADLASVDRTRTPWLVVFTHHPMYCSSMRHANDRCTKEAADFRSWLEPMFLQYGVDLHLCGHDHQYERSYPVANLVSTPSYAAPRVGPVYVVTGAAGNREWIDTTWMPGVSWRAWHDSGENTGFSRIEANATALRVAYVRGSTMEEIDSFTLPR